MTHEQWTIAEVAAYLGVSQKSADKQLRRWQIAAVARQPGRGGMNLYDAEAVQTAKRRRPGQGARTDLSQRRRAVDFVRPLNGVRGWRVAGLGEPQVVVNTKREALAIAAEILREQRAAAKGADR